MTNQINLIRKALSMELIKSQIQLALTKGELNQLLTEALADPESSAAIKKVLNPILANKFPQFPEFTVVVLGDTDESGSTQVILKQPPTPKATGPIKSIEPVVIDEPVVVPEPTPTPVGTDDDIFDSPVTNAYVEPNA